MVAISSVSPFLAVRKFHAAELTPAGSVDKGAHATLRGTIAEARRPPPLPRLTPGEVVLSELTVTERVGKQTNIAFRGKCPQVFSLQDSAGTCIDVDPRSAEMIDAHGAGEKLNKTGLGFQNWVAKQGRFRWRNTPATCHETSLRVGDVVTLEGQVILPLPGELQDGDSALRVLAKRISLYGENPWKGENGRTLLGSLITFAVSTLGGVGCVVWLGWL